MSQLNTFPTNKFEALALLQLSQQDLTKLSASDLLNKYQKYYEELIAADNPTNKDNFVSQII